MEDIYITRFSAWAPGVVTVGDWNEWVAGKRDILSEGTSPAIKYTDSTFRRRLSQISTMTIHIVHDLLPVDENAKILFFSFRGELAREYQLYSMLTEDGALRPAAFSLSGFNTPVALATIAFGLKGGYSALYPANNSFASCVKAAEAALLCGGKDELVLLYADENIPPECGLFFKEKIEPAAFGIYLSRKPDSRADKTPPVLLSSFTLEDDPLSFLKQLFLKNPDRFVQKSD